MLETRLLWLIVNIETTAHIICLLTFCLRYMFLLLIVKTGTKLTRPKPVDHLAAFQRFLNSSNLTAAGDLIMTFKVHLD